MHYLKKIEVEGFWETYDFAVDLHSDVNFFIGPNGTGKTTLINLLAAALTLDFLTLDRLSFKKLTMHLTTQAKEPAAKIVVLKESKKSRPFASIGYNIKRGNDEIKFSLDEDEEQHWLRRVDRHPRYVEEYYRRFSRGLTGVVEDLVQVNWLSINRAVADRRREERPHESSVDAKLEDLSNRLVRYFASLNKAKDDEVARFQEYIFASLLDMPGEPNVFRDAPLEKVDELKKAMVDIFSELHIQQRSGLIEQFFSAAGDLPRNFAAGATIEQFALVLSMRRIASVVQRWNGLQDSVATIFDTRTKFVDTANSLLQRKEMKIGDSNELIFVTRTGKQLTLQMLSSGEKQLLILLSEALLQMSKATIYIADEPELSLHVTWQEKLIPSLRTLNPNVQIIAATHSPDIVGNLTGRAHDMEKVLP